MQKFTGDIDLHFYTKGALNWPIKIGFDSNALHTTFPLKFSKYLNWTTSSGNLLDAV